MLKLLFLGIQETVRSLRNLNFLPVVMIADLIAAGVQEGYKDLKRPTIPEMWGHDMDVPETELNWIRRLSNFWLVGPSASV